MTSQRSPTRSPREDPSHNASENTPLLSDSESANGFGYDSEHRPQSIYDNYDAPATTSKSKSRWPTFITLGFLCFLAILIMIFAFFVPDTMERYATQAATLDLDSLVPEFTETGARARIRGTFSMQSSKVESGFLRTVGKFGTWVAREAETGESTVDVVLPDYNNALLGTAKLPGFKVKLADGRKTDLDIVADLTPPKSVDSIRTVIDQWLNQSLDHLNVEGIAQVKLRSGIVHLRTQTISQAIRITQDKIPTMPHFNITRLMFQEGRLPDGTKGMSADASITVENDFPIEMDIPPLSFDILVGNCLSDQPKIMLADASVDKVHTYPKRDVIVNATVFIRELPKSLTKQCPSSGKSPMDTLLGGYMKGHDIMVYVRGSKNPSTNAPKWITDLLSSVTVPVPVPGHTFGSIIHNFTLADVKFDLPDPLAPPDDPDSNPAISATIQTFIALPQEINVDVLVERVRATADVFYKQRKLGELNLRKWQAAKSTPSGHDEDNRPLILVESDIKQAPLEITDEDVFTDVIQAMLFGSKPIMLLVKAKVDVEIGTTLGVLTVRDIPAEGEVPVKPLSIGNGLASFKPKIANLSIVETSNTSLSLTADVDIFNPTVYSANVPYADVFILVNGTRIGSASVHHLNVTKGKNKHLKVKAVWGADPADGKNGSDMAREVVSRFISGYNLTLTIQAHNNTIPSNPTLGHALSKFPIDIPAPRINFPSDPNADPEDPEDPDEPDDNHPHFIQAATMHLFTSTAEFTLSSPLSHTTIYITSINATAFYDDEPIGTIISDLPLAVPPGVSLTPRLPVDWSLGSVGYEAVKRALGGTLKVRASAVVGIRIGEWEESVWYEGKGIGAKVRL
ncbi:hypothetical protein BT63DRAFT_70898 [Microthyrium microscopicum]|uniref:Pre-rRNA processing protein n=1 Tax=Microthyrium microscopicum TaxID=703497 RepID=A0A6A6U3E7_9PEZI|nr:hypothetical protein BT63DRAFT_70898 [Microthyrium microscopicum]